MRRSMPMLALVSVLVLFGAACGEKKDTGFPPIPTGTATETPCVQQPGTEPVEVHEEPVLSGDNFYAPLHAQMAAGDEVNWDQCGAAPHTVTFSKLDVDSSPDCTGSALSGCMQKGDTFKAKFEKAGKYHYYCKIHGAPNSDAGMYGYVTVT